MSIHRYNAVIDRESSRRLPGELSHEARAFRSFYDRTKNAIKSGNAEQALTHFRIAAEVWGAARELARAAADRGDPGFGRLVQQAAQDGDAILSLETMFARRFLEPQVREQSWWKRLFGG